MGRSTHTDNSVDSRDCGRGVALGVRYGEPKHQQRKGRGRGGEGGGVPGGHQDNPGCSGK